MQSSTRNHQSGVVLVISLVMLVLLTLIGVTGMQVTNLEEKIAGNIKNTNAAFQSAETALRERELWIQTNRPNQENINSTTLWLLNSPDSNKTDSTPWWEEKNHAWWVANGVLSTAKPAEVNTAPYSIVEFRYFKPDTMMVGGGSVVSGKNYYQITSRGTGGNDQAQVLLQSITAWGVNP
jgi:type IV pilus assembly protein PilX